MNYKNYRNGLPFDVDEIRYANARELIQDALLNPDMEKGAEQFKFAMERYGDVLVAKSRREV